MESTGQPEKKKWGCFKIGCIGLLALFGGVLLLLTIGFMLPSSMSDQPKNYPSSQLVLDGDDTFALLDRSSIADLERDINPNNNPAIEGVEEQLKKYEPGSNEWNAMNTVLVSLIGNYTKNVQRQYVASDKAEMIAPGTYTSVSYFNNDGESTIPRVGDMVWCEITYSGKTVYVLHQLHSSP